MNFISYFLSSEFIDTFVAIAFVIFVETKSITDIISSNAITEVSAIIFKYLEDSNYHLSGTSDNF